MLEVLLTKGLYLLHNGKISLQDKIPFYGKIRTFLLVEVLSMVIKIHL